MPVSELGKGHRKISPKRTSTSVPTRGAKRALAIYTPAAAIVASAHVEKCRFQSRFSSTRGDQPRFLFDAEQLYEAGEVIDRTLVARQWNVLMQCPAETFSRRLALPLNRTI